MFIRLIVMTIIFNLLAETTLFAEDHADGKNTELLKAVEILDTAFEKQDDVTIRKLIDPNHISIAPSYQFFNRKDQLKALPELKITLFEAEPKKILHVTPKTALISYKAKLAGTYAGEKLPARVQILESWVKRKGKWIEVSYQETPLP